METQNKTHDIKAVVQFLVDTYPNCFTLEGEAKPLKIGIFKDIAERLGEECEYSRTSVRAALRRYTASWRYLSAVKAGVVRVDLNGEAAGDVSEEHAQHAETQLAESKARAAERRKAAKPKPAPRSARAKVPAKSKGTKPARRKPNEDRPRVKAEPVDVNQLSVGQKVRVASGRGTVGGVVVEIVKEDVQVQLDSGLSIRLNSSMIRLPRE